MNISYNTFNRRREALRKKMAKLGPCIMATPSYCKNKPPASVKKVRVPIEERPEKMYITWTEAGNKSGSLYVPKDLTEEVKEWIENYWLMKEYLKEMTELSRKMIRLYAKSQGRRKKDVRQRKEKKRQKGE